MYLSIIVILALLVIVYIHYLRGFFSGTISAICAVVAAVLAFSLHETIVENYLGGKLGNSAHALVLLTLFPIIYLVLRTIFDALIPGQLRLPSTVDKVGGGLTGLVAGIFAVGICVIAAEELPFGPSIGGYSRYALNPHHGAIVPNPGGRSSADGSVDDELRSDESGNFGDDVQTLIVPVDDIVVGTVKYLSGGSLAGDQRLVDIHPDFLQETFGQRIGMEVGGKRVALNLEKQNLTTVTVKGVYTLASVAQADGELKDLRPAFTAKYTGPLTPKPEQSLVVVRVMFNSSAADEDNLVRFSPGSVRLVAQSSSGGVIHFANYYPVGTLQGADLLYRDKPDDPLFVNIAKQAAGADLVFLVENGGAFESDKADGKKFAPGTFIEVKRLGRVALGGMSLQATFVASPDVEVMRKLSVTQPPPPSRLLPKAAPAQPAAPPAAAPAAPESSAPPAAPEPTHPNSPQSVVAPVAESILTIQSVTQSDALPFPIAIGSASTKLQISLPNKAGDVMLKNDRFLSITIDAPQPVDQLQKGAHPTSKLLAPAGQGLVIVEATPRKGGWEWADKAADFEVVDAANKHYKAIGAWAKIQDGAAAQFIAHYSTDYPLAAIPSQQGHVATVWLCFGVPVDAEVKQVVVGTEQLGGFQSVKVTGSN